MSLVETLLLNLLSRVPAEAAHRLSIGAIRHGLCLPTKPYESERLRTRIGSLDLPNPLGLAAGFDKNATAVRRLSQCGFGFIESGTVTLRPQPGNPRPRLFRLDEDRAVINRIGFANDGAAAVARRLKEPRSGVLGVNIGANRDSVDRADDYCRLADQFGSLADFITVNISSPNTEGLRNLHERQALQDLLVRIGSSRAGEALLFLKISPDLSDEGIDDVADIAKEANIDAIIATNTTVERDNLISANRSQSGGLSGAPLFGRSTQVLAKFHTRLAGAIPLIGVGGITSGADAFAKIEAGASAVQLYTALRFGGLSLIARILRELDRILEERGFDSVKDAVGTNSDAWSKTATPDQDTCTQPAVLSRAG